MRLLRWCVMPQHVAMLSRNKCNDWKWENGEMQEGERGHTKCQGFGGPAETDIVVIRVCMFGAGSVGPWLALSRF